MKKNQITIASEVSISGKGLHTGCAVSITLLPAPANHGIVFQRIDLSDKPKVKAHILNVTDTSRSTNLQENGINIKTVEHLLAALAGMSIDNLLIHINAEEIPIMDGSAAHFISMIKKAGTKELSEEREYISVDEVVKFEKPDQGIELLLVPAEKFTMSVMVDYGTSVLSSQYASIKKMEEFVDNISSCRTFVFLHELHYLIKNNLVKGGELDNAIVFVDKKPNPEILEEVQNFFNKKNIQINENGTLNNVKLQFYNEPACHKLLDLLGDLYLLGKPIKGEIIARKPGHFANTEFVKLIYEYLENKGSVKKI
ncbi:MAG: UDP-3-O-acyl-N-acetylglucosamine deacetylase [Bacteroidales bacterium]|jgi:UDP-3-O-[3-hydroxymyristoyl] N-acetylglucosamine deacetylase/3-hydroxyacyl-[acyl-carrier-protein] dehydratase|nr:UDP-3-O-acyl-N-acetylglucosamine deacetylase [Bacteroidales bacterium]